MTPPAIVIHSLHHARAALRAAGETGEALVLVSPPGAAAYVGPGWFREVIDQARQAHPAVRVDAFLDCGARPGDALAAFRAGVPGVIFTGELRVADKLAALAEARGIAFRRARPEAVLDLLDATDPVAECRRALRRH